MCRWQPLLVACRACDAWGGVICGAASFDVQFQTTIRTYTAVYRNENNEVQAGLQIRAYGRIREFLREFLTKSGGENLSEQEISSFKS